MGSEEDLAEQGTSSPAAGTSQVPQAAPLEASEDADCPICLDTRNNGVCRNWCRHCAQQRTLRQRGDISTPLCGKEAASFLGPPAPQLSQQKPCWWPHRGPREGPKQVPEAAPRWPQTGSAHPGLQLLKKPEAAAEKGSGRCLGCRTGRPALLKEEPAPPAGRLGFLQATARNKEPIPAQVPQHLGPSTAGVAKEDGLGRGPSSKPRTGSPSLFWEKSAPSAGTPPGFLQATARNKEPIPAQVPQPCQARGLVAHPTKKGHATLAPDQHLLGQRKEPRDTESPRGGGCVAAEGHLDGGSGTVATWVVCDSGSGSEQDQGSLTAPAEAGTAPVVSSHDKSWEVDLRRWEGTSGDHLVQARCWSGVSQSRLSRAASSRALMIAKDGASGTPLGNLFPGSTSLQINKFCIAVRERFFSFNWCLLLCLRNLYGYFGMA
ncbi:uncharacterized protein ACIBXB_001956 [Morphnus guianensis]